MARSLQLACVALLLAAVTAGCGREQKTIGSFEDAATARIGVMTGSTGEAIAAARFPRAKIERFDDVMDAVTAMKSGQLDAIVTAFPAALQVTKKNPEFGLLPDALSHEDSAIAVRKDNDELLAAVNRIIAELKADGTLDSMKTRWFKADTGPYEEPEIPLSATGEVLRVGVSATREPFSFVDANGRVTGHDGELARIIGARLQRPVEFSDMKFMALIPALQSGKIDLIVTGMTATDERRKSVNFSQPYYANAQVMLVRKSAGDTAPAASPPSAKTAAQRKAVAGLADIDGKRIAVLSGSAGDLAARKRFPHASFQVAPAAADAALAVKSSKADAFVYDRSVLLNLVERNPELVIIDEPVAKLEVAAAIAMDNTALLADLDRVLRALQDEGALAGLRDKWVDSGYSVVPALPAVDDRRTQGVLRMGTCALIEPFSFHTNGTITGLDIELAHLIGERLGKKIEIVDMSFESLIPALQAGKIDFALSNFNVTDERRKLVLFSMPYITNDISALVRRPAQPAPSPTAGDAGGQLQLASPADLKDKRIGVLLGSAHDTYATRNYPQATILQYKSPADVALAVRTGKVDAALFDAEPLRDIMRQDSSLGILGDPLFSFPVAAGFASGNDDLREQFNRFLAEIRRNGVYDDMVERWMEKRDENMPQIDNPRTGGPLVVGVSDVGMPFTAVKDGRLVGFDIELAERFGASLGREVRLSNMDFGSLIAAVSTGKADLIASSIYVTEEREKQIDFSDPYFEMGTLAFALKSNIAGAATEPSAPAPVVRLASPDDIADKRVGVLQGSVHDTYVDEHYPRAVVLQYKSPSDLILAVRAGKVDAGLYTRETLAAMLRDDPELGLVGDSLQSYPVGIGFGKDDDALREQFNAFLKEIRESGVYDDMVARWMAGGATTMPELPAGATDGVLVAGVVSDKGLPFTIVRDGRLVGFDIELAERFGARIGKRIKWSDMEFGSLIAALAAGKIDMIVSTLVLTEERRQQVDFSDPYYELGASVFALKRNIVAPAAAAGEEPGEVPFYGRVAESFHSNIILENRYLLIWDGLKTTVLISVLATLFGTLLGAVVCFMRMSRNAVLNVSARVYIAVLRGTPVLVLLMLIFYVVFASVDINPALVAVIAFGMNFAAYVSEIFRTGIQGVDKGQTEAGISIGFTRTATFVYIVLPQTVQRILPVYKGEFISLVKMTSIVGYIAVQDLTKASDIIRSRTFDAFFPLVMVAILYFAISWILMQSLEYLEKVTDPKFKRSAASKA